MIPGSFASLSVAALDAKKIKGWLFKNIEHFSKAIEDVDAINFIYNTAIEKNHPDAVVETLWGIVGKSMSSSFQTNN